jgi:hypothetical protein
VITGVGAMIEESELVVVLPHQAAAKGVTVVLQMDDGGGWLYASWLIDTPRGVGNVHRQPAKGGWRDLILSLPG